MVKCLLLLVLVLMCAAQSRATTWYVRADGGTRWSPRVPEGQCDGQADAPYPGKGTHRHCAFNDYRYLWDDKSYRNHEWVIAGGDTVILDNSRPWRVGFDQETAKDEWCAGGNGPYDCTNPPLPAGTAAEHTRILGRNYAACSKADGQPDPAKMSQIFGGHALNSALNLAGAQFAEVRCVEVTQHGQCMVHGLPVVGQRCSTGYPVSDFDSNGIVTSTSTHDLLLEDVYVHGHINSGIQGNIGGTVIARRVVIALNGMSGWNFDDGSHESGGSLTLDTVSIIGSGCLEQYPAVGPFPARVCYDQESAGYGDGLGTQKDFGMDVSIDHSVFAYNTQDGVDLGHIDTGRHTLRITNSLAYGNMGGQFKWGANFQSATFANNRVLGNCMRMEAPIAGALPTFNAHLSDFCRANDTLSFNLRDGGRVLMANNRIVSYAPTTFDIGCWDKSCGNAVTTFENNFVLGYENSRTVGRGGQPGGPGGFYFSGQTGKLVRQHNVFFGFRNVRCLPGSTDRCLDPHFVNEPHFNAERDLDDFNFSLSGASPKP